MQPVEETELIKAVVRISRSIILIASIAVLCVICVLIFLFNERIAGPGTGPGNAATVPQAAVEKGVPASGKEGAMWNPPDATKIPGGKSGDSIRYGAEIIEHTAEFYGPKGSIGRISNGLNCQNCHLNGGRQLFGNNYSVFIANYPKMSGRSGTLETPAMRLMNCFERSLSGQSPDTSKREIKSMLAYLKWMGQGVKPGAKLFGSGTEKLKLLERAADPVKGEGVFVSKCRSCHGSRGEGLLSADKTSFIYPPLWGKHSYNDGAGMFRISNLAGFVKNNMPFGVTYQNPQLTDVEAWNVAAYINSQPRPHKDQRKDWPKKDKKPVDFPFGPYADGFSEIQHKYGPFQPIIDAQKELVTKH